MSTVIALKPSIKAPRALKAFTEIFLEVSHGANRSRLSKRDIENLESRLPSIAAYIGHSHTGRLSSVLRLRGTSKKLRTHLASLLYMALNRFLEIGMSAFDAGVRTQSPYLNLPEYDAFSGRVLAMIDHIVKSMNGGKPLQSEPSVAGSIVGC